MPDPEGFKIFVATVVRVARENHDVPADQLGQSSRRSITSKMSLAAVNAMGEAVELVQALIDQVGIGEEITQHFLKLKNVHYNKTKKKRKTSLSLIL